MGAMTGLWLSEMEPREALIDWLLVGALMVLIVALLPRRQSVRCFMLLLSLAVLGFARTADHVARVDPHALRHWQASSDVLVRVRGVLQERLLPLESSGGDAMDRWIRPPSDSPWKAVMHVAQIHDGATWKPSHGIVKILLTITPEDVPVGSMIEVIGWMSPMRGGAPDVARDDRMRHDCGAMVAVIRTDVPPWVVHDPSTWCRLVNGFHQWLDSNLLACLGFRSPEGHRALLVAMTTGRTLPGLQPFHEIFHQAGLSHFLAISGFNVTILLVMARILMQIVHVPWRIQGWSLLTLALTFVVAVEPGVSVVRAGLSGIFAGLALSLRRGWRPQSVLGVCMTLLLLWDPCLAGNLGFQLSFGAVIGLLYGTNPVLRLLPGLHDGASPRRVTRLTDGIRMALAASIAAWLISIPITLHAVGVTHPWCALTSTILGPCAALITIVASTGAVTGWIPGCDHVFQPILDMLVTCMRWGISMSGTLPGSIWEVGRVPAWWCLTAMAALIIWWTDSSRIVARGWVLSLIGVWFIVALLLVRVGEPVNVAERGSLRWTCLSLGNGLAHVIQHGEIATVVDAGSRSRFSTGSRVLVPALRALGVRAIDRIVIRGASLDRFSAVPELLHAFPVQQALLSGEWFRDWRNDTAQAALLRSLESSGIPIRNLDVVGGWNAGTWSWTCARPLVPGRTDGGAAVILIRDDHRSSMPALVLLRGCDETTIWHAMDRSRLRGARAIEWPPDTPIARDDSGILAALEPGHVIQVRGDEARLDSRLRRSLGWRPWGVLEQDATLQFRISDPGDPGSLFRWSAVGWVPVIRE
jgi:ComEC/Rec2-related protein